jgi:hypothetical protein
LPTGDAATDRRLTGDSASAPVGSSSGGGGTSTWSCCRFRFRYASAGATRDSARGDGAAAGAP